MLVAQPVSQLPATGSGMHAREVSLPLCSTWILFQKHPLLSLTESENWAMSTFLMCSSHSLVLILHISENHKKLKGKHPNFIIKFNSVY